MILIKVSATSKPTMVAGSIAGQIRERGCVTVQAIGAGAVNQAVKSLIKAGSYLADEQVKLAITPSLVMVFIDGRECTAVRFEVSNVDNS